MLKSTTKSVNNKNVYIHVYSNTTTYNPTNLSLFFENISENYEIPVDNKKGEVKKDPWEGVEISVSGKNIIKTVNFFIRSHGSGGKMTSMWNVDDRTTSWFSALTLNFFRKNLEAYQVNLKKDEYLKINVFLLVCNAASDFFINLNRWSAGIMTEKSFDINVFAPCGTLFNNSTAFYLGKEINDKIIPLTEMCDIKKFIQDPNYNKNLCCDFDVYLSDMRKHNPVFLKLNKDIINKIFTAEVNMTALYDEFSSI